MEEGTLNNDLTQFLPYKKTFEEVTSSKYPNETDKMFYLCKKGYVNLLKSLLKNSDDKNPQDGDKYTLIHCAAEHGQLNIVEYLLPLLGDKNPKTGPRKYETSVIHNITPLDLAAWEGHLSIIEFMVPYVRYDDCLDTIFYLCKGGHLELLKPFLQVAENKNSGDQDMYELLHCAAEHGQLLIVEHLVQGDEKNHSEATKKYLRLAAIKEDLSVVEILAPHMNDECVDILFYLCKKGHLQLLKPLLQALENTNPGDKNKNKLLHCAIEHGQLSIVEFLVPMLNDNNLLDPDKMSILHFSSEHGQSNILKYLIQTWYKKNLRQFVIELFAPQVNGNRFSDTLFYLCEKGQLVWLKPLLENLEHKNRGDKNKFLYCAAEHDQFHILEYFVQLWYKQNPKQFIIKSFAPYVNGSGFISTLFYLCEIGSLVWLKPLLENLEDKNLGDKYKSSIMYFAANHGQFNILEYLTQLWHKKNSKQFIIELFAPHVNGSRFGDTLFYLCEKGQLVWLKPLLNKNRASSSIMHCAAEHDQFHILEYLAELWYKKSPTQFIIESFAPYVNGSGLMNTLFYLCEIGSLVWLKQLLKNLEPKNPGDPDKYTLLHAAADHGQLNIVEYLIPLLDDKNPKAGPRKYDSQVIHDGMTPMHLAARKGHLSIIKLMVPHLNGNINPADCSGFTVLHEAAYFGHYKLVAFFTSKLDDPNPGEISKNKFRGRTPLHYAAQQGHLKVVKHLCSRLHDKNPTDDHGDTPLHRAAYNGNIDIVKYLVQFLENKQPIALSILWLMSISSPTFKGQNKVLNFLKNI